MTLIKNNPAVAIAALLAVVVLAVFGWLYATDTDREPASAQSTVPAVAPSVAAPTAAAPTTAPAEDSSASADPQQDESAAPAEEPADEPSALPTFAAGSDHAQAPEAGDWREPAEAFAAAYATAHGGDQEAWLAGMKPYITEELYENFTYTDMYYVSDDEVESVASVEINPTTMIFRIYYAEAGSKSEALMELQPSGEWLVSALGQEGADVE